MVLAQTELTKTQTLSGKPTRTSDTDEAPAIDQNPLFRGLHFATLVFATIRKAVSG
jgi:hypothetical protein